MANRICSIDGCEKDGRAGRGWCWTHYSRWRAHGSTDLPVSVAPPCHIPGCHIDDAETCHFPGCGRPHYSRGICPGHYTQLRNGRAFTQLREKRPTGSHVGKTCEFKGCQKPQFARGLCSAHSVQRNAGKELTPLRLLLVDGLPVAMRRDADGNKHCPSCETWRPEGDFYRSAGKPDGRASSCAHCMRLRGRRQLLMKYNVTVEWYDNQLAAQGGSCAICSARPGKRMLAVDHDHTCCPSGGSCGSCVRGLLCGRCNFALGNFEDDRTLLRSAADYLDSPPTM